MQDMNGKIDISRLSVPPEKHELATARFFAALGKDITFLCPSQIPNQHTPDIIMDGIEWEVKSPTGSGRNVIGKNFKRAAAQSGNIIFDLRRCNAPEKRSLSQLQIEFNARTNIRHLLVIKKDGELLRFDK